MKILHINSYYGAGLFYKNLYDRQRDLGLGIDVFVPIPTSSALPAFDRGDYTALSANHGRYDRLFFHLKHHKIYRDLLARYVPNEFNLVHAHSLFSNGYIAWRLKKDFGTPYLVAVRNTDLNVFFKYMVHLRGLGLEIMKEAGQVIFLSAPYRDRVIEKIVPAGLRAEILSKSEVIPNGIDDFWLRNKPAEPKKIEDPTINLIYAGWIARSKNPLTTVKACRILLRAGYEVTFTLVGRIKEGRLYRAITAHDFVRHEEHQPKESLIDYYRNNDIFVMPSRAETFGLVYAEALSQGLPVIYTRGQGFDGQFAEGEIGYSVDCCSPAVIADRIIDILKGYEVLSKNCLLKVERFSWDRIAGDYMKIYTSFDGGTP